jgi:hypothetical protein
VKCHQSGVDRAQLEQFENRGHLSRASKGEHVAIELGPNLLFGDCVLANLCGAWDFPMAVTALHLDLKSQYSPLPHHSAHDALFEKKKKNPASGF